MNTREDVARESKWRERRRGSRLNSTVPVAIEWEDTEGKTVRAEAQTRMVGPYGCLVILPHSLSLDQKVRLTNLATQQTAGASLVWKGKERVEGWEWGIELVEYQHDFWGLEI